MQFREATESDLRIVSKDSISRGCREFPEAIDLVYALEHDDIVLGVGGLKLMNEHTAWVWMDMHVEARKHIKLIIRLLKRFLDGFASKRGITRLMAAVDVDFPEAIRTVEHLGFHRESRMKAYNGDTDAFLYVKLSEVK
jgi:RimJ/RimL family protein N-acetyltransferase